MKTFKKMLYTFDTTNSPRMKEAIPALVESAAGRKVLRWDSMRATDATNREEEETEEEKALESRDTTWR